MSVRRVRVGACAGPGCRRVYTRRAQDVHQACAPGRRPRGRAAGRGADRLSPSPASGSGAAARAGCGGGCDAGAARLPTLRPRSSGPPPPTRQSRAARHASRAGVARMSRSRRLRSSCGGTPCAVMKPTGQLCAGSRGASLQNAPSILRTGVSSSLARRVRPRNRFGSPPRCPNGSQENVRSIFSSIRGRCGAGPGQCRVSRPSRGRSRNRNSGGLRPGRGSRPSRPLTG